MTLYSVWLLNCDAGRCLSLVDSRSVITFSATGYRLTDDRFCQTTWVESRVATLVLTKVIQR
ncbi:hypothetical protein QWZ16_10970 [Vibrio ostreicida]|uniref:Uncharacterized protein n=1 Tax=Vibrio ostreicida TaxID=526588 RepID=A0ABT8BVV8_9VIBR|nr:hypothetical protein [Vibrio ostreicida]MDN3610223.1 hypothetical protein [Vibrio ostreicida]